MAKRGRKAKDKFDALSSTFRDAVLQSSTDEIRKRISEVAMLDVAMRKTLKEDPEVCSAKEKLKNLMEPYREDFKSYRLQLEFCKQALDNKGGGANVANAETNVVSLNNRHLKD